MSAFDRLRKNTDEGTYQNWTWRIPIRHLLSSGACDRCWSAVADLMGIGNCVSDLKKAHIPHNESVTD